METTYGVYVVATVTLLGSIIYVGRYVVNSLLNTNNVGKQVDVLYGAV